jgi:hypothetical protein
MSVMSEGGQQLGRKGLELLTCSADHELVGKVQSVDARLSEDETTVFADYDIEVEEAIKGDVKHPISSGSGIVVTRNGGTVSYNGRTITVLDEGGIDSLHKGERVLLFLRNVPSTGAYQQSMPEGVFFLARDNTVYLPLSIDGMEEGRQPAEEFLRKVRSLASLDCVRRERESGANYMDKLFWIWFAQVSQTIKL